jgi:hypothetical protein
MDKNVESEIVFNAQLAVKISTIRIKNKQTIEDITM